jgi:hypothetical protein
MFCSSLIFRSSVLGLTDDRKERTGKEAAMPLLKTVSQHSLTHQRKQATFCDWLPDTTPLQVTPDAWYSDLLHSLNWRIIQRPAALQTAAQNVSLKFTFIYLSFKNFVLKFPVSKQAMTSV